MCKEGRDQELEYPHQIKMGKVIKLLANTRRRMVVFLKSWALPRDHNPLFLALLATPQSKGTASQEFWAAQHEQSGQDRSV